MPCSRCLEFSPPPPAPFCLVNSFSSFRSQLKCHLPGRSFPINLPRLGQILRQGSHTVCNFKLNCVTLTFASPTKSVRLEGTYFLHHSMPAPTIHSAHRRNIVIICRMNVYLKCMHPLIFQLGITFLTKLLSKYDLVYNLKSAEERAWALEYAFMNHVNLRTLNWLTFSHLFVRWGNIYFLIL